ncbi:MAG: hypothetical protein IPI60_04380 [Saprospiraceae bacterium]|nr:hypothetical protein [Saprospiraceae bacterium]
MKINELLIAILFAGSILFLSCGITPTEETESPINETTEDATETTQASAIDVQVVGTWVMITEDGTEKGFTLNANGTFENINMADLTITQWDAPNAQLLLTGPSAEGAEPVLTVCSIARGMPDVLTVNDGTNDIEFTRKK